MSRIVLGTRGSDLALAQADMVTDALNEAYPSLEVVREVLQTVGDKRPDLKLSEFATGENPIVDKGIFTRELEIALAEGQIDLAVHSLKDVPTVLADSFKIAGVLERAPVADVLVVKGKWDGGGVEALPPQATVATSSVRRARQLRWIRPDLEVVDIRGNVPTRIIKTAAGQGPDFTMLAMAGLKRLGMWCDSEHDRFLIQDEGTSNEPTEVSFEALDPSIFLPAAGQGAVGIEVRSDDKGTAALVGSINHQKTWIRVCAEREFLRLLEAGCQTPVGAHTWFEEEDLHMAVRVFSDEEGQTDAEPIEATGFHSQEEPEALAAKLFAQL